MIFFLSALHIQKKTVFNQFWCVDFCGGEEYWYFRWIIKGFVKAIFVKYIVQMYKKEYKIAICTL